MEYEVEPIVFEDPLLTNVRYEVREGLGGRHWWRLEDGKPAVRLQTVADPHTRR